MSGRLATKTEADLLRRATARLRAGIMAIVCGMTAGTGMAAATLWLVVRDGPRVGLHLGLLGNYFPGYSVTWMGVALGFLYGTLTGAILGWSVAWVYNQVADRRPGRK